MSATEATMREQLEEAFNESEDEEAGAEAGQSDENAEESVGSSSEDPAGEESPEEGASDDTGEQSEDKDAAESEEEANEDEAGAAEEPDPAKSGSGVKAPASWKPAAREQWAKIPEGAQREIARREKHMDKMVRDSADARKHHDEFQQLIQPYETLIAAQKSTPFQAVQNLMQTAAGLTLGSPTQKAQVISNIIKEYGVDIEELDNVLVGNGGGQQVPANGMQQILQQELAPIRQFMGDISSQRQTYQTQQENSISTEIDTFAADPKNEFFEDVRENMADLMELSANRNESMSIQQAYETACRMDPDIHSIVNKRQLAAEAAANRKNVSRKRHAASSVHGNPAGEQSGQGSATIRGAITEAWDDAS